MDHTESAWHRGWADTKHAWGDWRFIVLDVIVVPTTGIALALAVSPVWGTVGALLLAAVSMVSIWIFATLRAPYHQRDEARKVVLDSASSDPVLKVPKNRDALIVAIKELERAANERIVNQIVIAELRQQQPDQQWDEDDATRRAFYDAKHRLETETSVAGKYFEVKLQLHLAAVSNVVYECVSDDDPPKINGEAYKDVHSFTDKLLKSIDDGRLYFSWEEFGLVEKPVP